MSKKGMITYTFKVMGVSIKENKNPRLKINFFGDWNKFDKKFAFLLWEKFDSRKLKEDDFKNIKNYCIANNYKIIIISNKESDEFEGDDYKVISYNSIKKFSNLMNKVVMTEGENLQKLVA